MKLKKYSKTNNKSGYLLKERKHYDCLTDDVRWFFHENQISLQEHMPLKKTKIYSGVESLRYLIVARTFVEKRYSLSGSQLEAFLLLYPYNYFTKDDYDNIAKPFKVNSIKYNIKKGFVEKKYDKKHLIKNNVKRKTAKDIYALTRNAKRAVTDFYKIISGEMKPHLYKNTIFDKNPEKNELIRNLIDEVKNS